MADFEVLEHFCTNIKLFEVEHKGNKLEITVPCLDCRVVGPPLITIALNKAMVMHKVDTPICKNCGFKVASDSLESRVDVLNRVIIPVIKTKSGLVAEDLRGILNRIAVDVDQPTVDQRREMHNAAYEAVEYIFDLCGVWLPDFEALRNYGTESGDVNTLRIEVDGGSKTKQAIRRIPTNISLKLRGEDTNIWYNDVYVKGIPGWEKIRTTPYLYWQAPFEGGQRLANVSGANLRPYKGVVQTTFLTNGAHSKTYQTAVKSLVS